MQPVRVTVRLRALHGTPLDDAAVRRTVVSTAHALAERHGIVVEAVETSPESIVLTLGCDRLVATGLLAELRRSTNQWYEARFRDGPLWGTPAPGNEPPDPTEPD